MTEGYNNMSIIEEILKTATGVGASDVHMTVGIPPKMRVNGALATMDYPPMRPEDTRCVARLIMTDEQWEVFEQKGEMDMSFSVPKYGRFRLNAYKQRGSAALAFRLVGTKIPSAEELGVPDCVMNLCEKQRGLILVTGPTGCGKSTTLAAMIDRINTNREAHVITLEDPIEFLHQHKRSMVNQREIGLDSADYASALRAALREDPDVILVGEMRDLETISVAITAAETGHLVLSTLHTIGAANTIDRIIDVFPPHQQQQIRVQLAGVMEAIVSQQLIPTVDEKGRAAVFEILLNNPAVRNLIREGKAHQLPGVMQTNRKCGMITMDDAIIDLYESGRIDRYKALQFAQDGERMQNRLK